MSMKVALVGIGKIAVDQHIPSIRASRDWELAATVSRHGVIEGIDHYTDITTMLGERPDIECVSLCLPPVPRFEYAVAALEDRRHVMLEKPPGASIAECQALERLARAAGVSIYATWHSREATQVDAAKAWLAGKNLRKLTITWKEDVRRWHPGQTWIWEAGGLGVFDPGINALSILTKILAVPIHVTSAVLFVPENCETPIAADVAFFHPDGAEVTAHFDFRQDGEQIWSIDVDTDDGTMSLVDGGARLAINGIWRDDRMEEGNPLVGEYPRLYARMADLVRTQAIEMDLSPLVHVADAFFLGKRITVEPFHE